MKTDYSANGSQLLDLETRLFGLPLEELWLLTAYDKRVQRFRQVLENRYTEFGLSIIEISRDCGMTASNFNRIMGSLTGCTGYQLLISYRIYRSIHEALEVNSRFAEIALHHGFDNSASYSRTVRRVLGWPPSKLIPRSAGFRRELNLPPLNPKEGPAKPSVKLARRPEELDLL